MKVLRDLTIHDVQPIIGQSARTSTSQRLRLIIPALSSVEPQTSNRNDLGAFARRRGVQSRKINDLGTVGMSVRKSRSLSRANGA